MNKKIFWCTSCLNMSTRPRIKFDDLGKCNACTWSEKKRSMDWASRKNELMLLLDKHRSKDGSFDCIVPCSGGKDGSYVAYNLKHKFGMHPLCITVRPALELELGEANLKAFINSGYDHIHITPDPEAMRTMNTLGFKEKGFPYYGWLTAIQTIPLRLATQFGINLIFYGEDGEVEYGGSTETNMKPTYDYKYMQKVYLEGGHEMVLKLALKNGIDHTFFHFPEDSLAEKLEVAHWSYFEPWDSYHNYIVAKEHCGLKEQETSNSGTFTNFSQNDQALYSLHAYLMYLKFGFGRATQDAGIEIRRGAMDRDQALNLVQMFDGHYPEEHVDDYLNYYGMTQSEFDTVIDRYANRDLFQKADGRWVPKFFVGKDFFTCE
ncbi:N-acetyl sugar amidotransferase [Amylibacter sp.]|nr:N-acetyl sugar amidotransferase [Amylibacter sp.]